jgi:hypothetical protein
MSRWSRKGQPKNFLTEKHVGLLLIHTITTLTAPCRAGLRLTPVRGRFVLCQLLLAVVQQSAQSIHVRQKVLTYFIIYFNVT